VTAPAAGPAPQPTAETPSTALKAGLLPIAAQGIVLMLAFIAGLIVKPSNGGGMEDLGAIASVFLGGEIVLGLTALVLAMVRFRRGRQYTGLGLVGGWIVSLAVVFLIFRLLSA
jgi:hypothetical protein